MGLSGRKTSPPLRIAATPCCACAVVRLPPLQFLVVPARRRWQQAWKHFLVQWQGAYRAAGQVYQSCLHHTALVDEKLLLSLMGADQRAALSNPPNHPCIDP